MIDLRAISQLKARAKDIAQLILSDLGSNISRDDALQLEDTALVLLQTGKIRLHHSLEQSADKVLRTFEWYHALNGFIKETE